MVVPFARSFASAKNVKLPSEQSEVVLSNFQMVLFDAILAKAAHSMLDLE